MSPTESVSPTGREAVPAAPAAARAGAPAPALHIDLDVPERGARLRLDPAPGRITAVIGPNGSGKSTLLGALAGTVAARGSLRLGEEDLARRPAHRRGLGHLQQDAALFEHLSVRENVAFGPRARGIGRAEARRRAEQLLETVGVADLAARRPRSLSGGQAQRVAIARALATDPDVLLLDEPFAALDADVTGRLRTLLATTLAGRTVLLVTHELLDVLALADDVVVLSAGRVLAHGPREEILARPPSAFAARLTGRFLVPGILRAGGVLEVDPRGEDGTGEEPRERADRPWIRGVPDAACVLGEPTVALVDPSRVTLSVPEAGADDAAGRDPRRALALEGIDRLGSHVLVRAGGMAAEIPAARALALDLRPGMPVHLDVDPDATPLYPR